MTSPAAEVNWRRAARGTPNAAWHWFMARATRAEAALSAFDPERVIPGAKPSVAIRVAEAMRTVELSWAEAVAIVQAVCVQLESGRMPPAIGDLRICASGLVTFPAGGLIDEDVAIQLTARLLARLLGDGPWPLELCTALERAQTAPMRFGSVRGFGTWFTCVPAGGGAALIAAYVRRVGVLIDGRA
jgi:hypothetical protein